ncbi:MAG: hypothetical protein EOO23_02535 [Comamonadaceae bacterium]|nr:MAG: hypothetical protein EOO23_02535 [Comamonadaceae bacterium]
MTLYGDHNRQLFQWNGKAVSAASAEQFSFDTYSLAVQALCRAQGVSASLNALDLTIRASDIRASSAPDGWRIRYDVPERIKNWQGASLTAIKDAELLALVASGALIDPVCREAARELRQMRIGFWFCHAGGKGLNDVGACLLINRDGREVRHQFESAALRDALRILSLRTRIPFSHGTPLPEFHPFCGPTCEVVLPNSAVVRALLLTDPPQPPELLIQWLTREGCASVADRLRAVFAMAGGSQRRP